MYHDGPHHSDTSDPQSGSGLSCVEIFRGVQRFLLIVQARLQAISAGTR
jgi:hypothetical protein